MRKYRRHAVVLILIVAAVITPSPDVISQLIVALPIYVLYEVSIFIAKAVHKH
jgi:sec-independent protein translocase protein TatC